MMDFAAPELETSMAAPSTDMQRSLQLPRTADAND